VQVLSIDHLVDAIETGSAFHPLQRLVEIAAHVARTPGAILTARRGNFDIVLASRGIPHLAKVTRLPALPGTQSLLGHSQVIEDSANDPIFARHPLAHDGTGWRWAVIVPVHLAGTPPGVVLTCGDPRHDIERPPDFLERLQRMARIIADEIELIGEIVSLTNAARDAAAPRDIGELPLFELPMPGQPAESSNVVTEFLLSTLIPQRRMLRRGDVPYHAINKWRASLKAWQIMALRALKRDPPPSLVDKIANDLASAARSFWGTNTFQAVIPVPCGNSGPNCLAERLSIAVAARLNVPVVTAFEPMDVKGVSHPRRNARRPAMVLREAPTIPVVLIDDVASSGAHIEEAATLLRQSAPAVFALVWIAN